MVAVRGGMLCLPRWLGSLTISISVLLCGRAGAQSPGNTDAQRRGNADEQRRGNADEQRRSNADAQRRSNADAQRRDNADEQRRGNADAQRRDNADEASTLPAEQARTRDVARAAEGPRPVTVGRVVVEGVGLVTGAFFGSVLGVAFIGLTSPNCDSERERDFCGTDSLAAGAIFGLGSAILLMPAGTYVAGNAMGGKGGYGWTLLGSSIGVVGGALASVPLFTMEREHEDTGALLGTLVLTSSILAGNVLGYELSSASAARRARAKATHPGLSVYPHARVSSGRFVLGVTGGF